jgi:Spy/CpxP family protein refolding chaperone
MKTVAGAAGAHKSLPAAIILIASVCFSLGLGVAFAQNAQGQSGPDQSSQAPSGQTESGPSSGRDRHMGRHRMRSVDDQVKHMTRKLNLSDDQQAKLKPILEDQRTQMEQIRSDSSLSRDDRFSKMKSVHENSMGQIKSILNEDQQKKFEQMQEKRREHMGHRGPGNGPSDTPSQPQ